MREFDSTEFGNVWLNSQADALSAKGIDVNNVMSPTAHRILKVSQETENEFTFRVEFKYLATHGQFFMLSIPKFGEAPISVSGMGEGYVEFTVKKVGRLTEGVFNLREGDQIYMRGPFGHPWPLKESFTGKDKSLVVIVDDTGLTQVRTILNHFLENPEEIKKIYLIAGFRNADSAIYKEERAAWAASSQMDVMYVAEQNPSALPEFKTGTVLDFIDEIPFDSLGEYHVAIVGAPTVMRDAAEKCMQAGTAIDKIWVLFERRMSCAVGKCGHCKINETYVCLEGPVFNYKKASELFD